MSFQLIDAKLQSDKDKASYKAGLGAFYNYHIYMKLYEVLRGAYSSYKASLNYLFIL